MTERDEARRLREAWAALAEAEKSKAQVDDDAVWSAAAGEGTPAERLAMVDRVAADPGAAESWRLAVELQRELAALEPGRPAASPSRWRRRVLPLAAALLLAVGLGWWMRFADLLPSAPDEPVYREAGAPALHSLVPEDVPQPRDRVVLRWSDLGAGSRYAAHVLSTSSELLIVERGLEETRLEIGAEALFEVAPGERLLWWVEGRGPDGQSVVSQTFFLQLTAPESSTPSQNP